jgi:hypothetical protein
MSLDPSTMIGTPNCRTLWYCFPRLRLGSPVLRVLSLPLHIDETCLLCGWVHLLYIHACILTFSDDHVHVHIFHVRISSSSVIYLHLNRHRPGLRVLPCLLCLWCSCSCIVLALYPNQSRTDLFCTYFKAINIYHHYWDPQSVLNQLACTCMMQNDVGPWSGDQSFTTIHLLTRLPSPAIVYTMTPIPSIHVQNRTMRRA